MASHFKWYPTTEETVIPWNAQYEFPSQANKAVKVTPRIPPKNNNTFTPGSTIRLEFPAQGYINTNNTTIEFDVIMQGYIPSANTFWETRFQNNIFSVFDRLRILYGSTPLEDIIHPNFLVRQLTEFTTSNGTAIDQTSIAEGIGGYYMDYSGTVWAPYSTRQYKIQGLKAAGAALQFGVPNSQPIGGAGSIAGLVGPTCVRRYQVQLPAGLFQQGKYLPVKFMASQFAIELTLAQPATCMIAISNALTNPSPTLPAGTPSYVITNVNLIPEVLEFDSSYDQNFLQGLQTGGVPIQFASWHNFQFNVTGSSGQYIIQERSRSVKSIFAFMKLASDSLLQDSHATFSDLATTDNSAILRSYQFRIGARYLPASPVICYDQVSGTSKNGTCEPFIELQKALNTIGDYRLSTNLSADNWARPPVEVSPLTPGAPVFAQNSDYFFQPSAAVTATGRTGAGPVSVGNASIGSTVFCFATSLETTNGKEISGLNAEEQSDISLMINWAGPSPAYPMLLEVYTYYDAMMILRENNVVELIL